LKNPAAEMRQSLITTKVSNQADVREQQSYVLESAASRLALAGEGLLSNFEQMTSFSTASVPLLGLVLASIGIMTLLPLCAPVFVQNESAWDNSVAGFAWIALACGILLNEVFIARFMSSDGILEPSTISSIRRLQIVFVVGAIASFAARHRAAALLKWLTSSEERYKEDSRLAALFGLAVFVPWFTMLVVAEPARPDRYWWLWPLQVVTLAAAVTYLPKRLLLSRVIAWIGQITLTLLLLLQPWLLSRAQAWIKIGWSGLTEEQVAVVDYLAGELGGEGRKRVAIGYQTFIYGFNSKSNIVDPRYKAGAQFDMLFKYRHGILNSDQCAEGVSADDEYRIVQTRPKQREGHKDWFNEPPEEFFEMPRQNGFRLLRQIGDYQVLKRSGSG
jgi:hypothetical protein